MIPLLSSSGPLRPGDHHAMSVACRAHHRPDHDSGLRRPARWRQGSGLQHRGVAGGQGVQFSLADALKKGPVVLYFYPAAFTPGCTVEAHEFAEATAKFQQLGATVIGVSHDPIEKLDRFSVSECRNKFAVASDADGGIMKAYDSVLPSHPEYANRTSYVIAPSGEIIYSYTAMNPDKHVENTMAAVRKWQEAHKKT